MRNKLVQISTLILGLVALTVGYTLGAGTSSAVTPAEAYRSIMPTHPFIVYLAPTNARRGAMDESAAQTRGAIPLFTWSQLRSLGNRQPVDGLIMDAAMLSSVTASDRAWLHAALRNGVVLVGPGVDDDQFAAALGLETLRVPTEARVPIGSTGYRLVAGLMLGQPEEIQILESMKWFDLVIRGENTFTPSGLKHPTLTSFSSSRGTIDTQSQLDDLFARMDTGIQDAYQRRAEYQQQILSSKGK